MKKRRIPGSKEDEGSEDLWHSVTRSVTPYSLHKNGSPKTAAASVKKSSEKVPPPQKVLRRAPSFPPAAGKILPRGFDRSTEMKLRRGQLPLEGRLDLHGLTQGEAFDRLFRFIKSAVAGRKRTVLIITGRGGLQSGGVLKRMLPLWLEDTELGKHVIALTQAAQKDGGAGAFYLRLRK
ncbi:MAG: Smr/MutS family protein [Pseudomonadota bacterium]